MISLLLPEPPLIWPQHIVTSSLTSSVFVNLSLAIGHPNQLSWALTFSPLAAVSPPLTPPREFHLLPAPWPNSSTVFLLMEVTGMDNLVRVHVPFSLSKLLDRKDIGEYMNLTSNLLPEEYSRVWNRARTHADKSRQLALWPVSINLPLKVPLLSPEFPWY